MRIFYFAVLLLFGVFAVDAQAQVKMQGQFMAGKLCPAVVSIKKKSNPGDVSVEPGKSYVLLGKNKDQASHYWVIVPNANPSRRWVALDCGTVDATLADVPPSSGAAIETKDGTVKPKPKSQGPKDGVAFYVLALSWEPAFCEVMQSKSECKSQTATSYEASHFSLHGLWPQPRRNVFCGVDRATAALDDQHQWEKLPEPELMAATKAALDHVMPGTKSLLQRHEWIKHGTCYPGRVADTYFKDAIRLTQTVNTSVVQKFMADSIGKKTQTAQLRAKFDEAFGKGAGDRVRVACDKAGRFSEITIGLKGDISAGSSMADLIAAAETTDGGCQSGVVDAAGQ